MKDYKKILEGVVDIINTTEKSDIGFANICTYIGENCPELAESENERIRKRIIHALHGDVLEMSEIKKAIAWLEKQGEPTEINPSEFDLRLNRLLKQFDSLPKEELASSLSFYLNVVQNNGSYKEEKQGEQKLYVNDNAKEMFIKALERVEEQNNKGYKLTDCDKNSRWEDFKAYTSCIIEQKPADKVELKFHEGDWVVFNNRYDSVYQVERKENYEYTLRHFLGGSMPLLFSHEDMIRAWTIKDARNGDVLSDGTTIFIFKDLLSDGSVMSYCDYNTDSGESDAFCPSLTNLMCSKITPATKEQRDTLFDEMGKAGYWWDAAKKELNKIKPKFMVGDLVMVSTAVGDRVVQIASVGYLKAGHPSYFTTEGRWFDNRTKARLLTDMEISTLPESRVIVTQKSSEWSEEDENMVRYIGNAITCEEPAKYLEEKGIDMIKAHRWLESLRPQKQWKPSDEQIKAIKWIIVGDNPENWSVVLKNLYQDLKKLKE